MPYQLNPEWLAAAKPIMASMPVGKMIPNPAIHDVDSRRANSKAVIPHSTAFLPEPADVVITDHEFQSFDGATLCISQFQPGSAPETGGPAALHVHGGGMITGSVKWFARQTAILSSRSGVPLFSVGYRLAPEHPHPTPVKDVYAALLWLQDNAERFGIDKTRIALVGESAGGGIAAGAVLMARDAKLEPPLAKQVLVMPMLDDRTIDASAYDPEFLKPLVWSIADNITGWSALLGKKLETESADDVADLQYASPARAADLRGLPPTFVEVGTLDLFCREDVDFAMRLVRDGQSMVELHVYPGLVHGFHSLGFESEVVQMALTNRSQALKSL